MNRNAFDVINHAIKENRVAEYLAYIFATIMVIAGVFALIKGAFSEQPITALAGAVSNSLFYPAMMYSKKIRKENIAIRLLELPLSRASTADDAANAIRVFFLKTTGDESKYKRKKIR